MKDESKAHEKSETKAFDKKEMPDDDKAKRLMAIKMAAKKMK